MEGFLDSIRAVLHPQNTEDRMAIVPCLGCVVLPAALILIVGLWIIL